MSLTNNKSELKRPIYPLDMATQTFQKIINLIAIASRRPMTGSARRHLSDAELLLAHRRRKLFFASWRHVTAAFPDLSRLWRRPIHDFWRQVDEEVRVGTVPQKGPLPGHQDLTKKLTAVSASTLKGAVLSPNEGVSQQSKNTDLIGVYGSIPQNQGSGATESTRPVKPLAGSQPGTPCKSGRCFLTDVAHLSSCVPIGNGKRRHEEILFRIRFRGAIERGLTAFFGRRVEIPCGWLHVDPVKVAKFIFNAPLSIALETPLPPGEVPFEPFLPESVIRQVMDRDVRLAVVMSQLKRNMPLLTKDRIAEAKKKHAACVSRAEKDKRPVPNRLLKRACHYARAFARGMAKDWSVKDAVISESASFDTFMCHGGGRKEARCPDPKCDHGGQGAYHDSLWPDFMYDDINVARVAAVNSNMKARIVTAHHVGCNFFRPLQKIMHDRLRRIPVFELTGGMPTEETFRAFPASERDSPYRICSADYSCATDGINPILSRGILETILTTISPPRDLSTDEWKVYKKKALESLTSSTLFYGPLKTVEQNYGQMMGHLLSFPILNLVNFSIYAEYAIQVSTWSFEDALAFVTGAADTHLRINGDDLISRELQEHYPVFVETVAQSGWELSIGKTYLHWRYGCVNSQFFDFAKTERRFVAAEYKFGGLQKGATVDSFAQWLLRLEDPVSFVSFYKDWIYQNFGHPRVSQYFKYLDAELQRKLIHLFPSLSTADWFRSVSYKELTEQTLLEEEKLEKEFRAGRDDLIDPREYSHDEELKFPPNITKMLVKCGFTPNSDRSAILQKVLAYDPVLGDMLARLNKRSVDDEYWTFVGKWRQTRLRVEEYKRIEQGSRAAFCRLIHKPRGERRRLFSSWRKDCENAVLRQKQILRHPRFLVRPPLLCPQQISAKLIPRGDSADHLEIREDQHILCNPKVTSSGIQWIPSIWDERFSLRRSSAEVYANNEMFVRGATETSVLPKSDWKRTLGCPNSLTRCNEGDFSFFVPALVRGFNYHSDREA